MEENLMPIFFNRTPSSMSSAPCVRSSLNPLTESKSDLHPELLPPFHVFLTGEINSRNDEIFEGNVLDLRKEPTLVMQELLRSQSKVKIKPDCIICLQMVEVTFEGMRITPPLTK